MFTDLKKCVWLIYKQNSNLDFSSVKYLNQQIQGDNKCFDCSFMRKNKCNCSSTWIKKLVCYLLYFMHGTIIRIVPIVPCFILEKIWQFRKSISKKFGKNSSLQIQISSKEEPMCKKFFRIIPEHFACCSLLFARCLLLFARCSLLFARCSLLFARCLLLFARCSLLFARYFLLAARYFLFVGRYFLLVAPYFLLVARYFNVQITVK